MRSYCFTLISCYVPTVTRSVQSLHIYNIILILNNPTICIRLSWCWNISVKISTFYISTCVLQDSLFSTNHSIFSVPLQVGSSLFRSDDVIASNQASWLRPQVPPSDLHSPGLPVRLLSAFWGSRRWWRRNRRRRGGRAGRPGGQPVRRFTVFIALLRPAGGEAAASCMEAPPEFTGTPGEPQHGAAERP